jgi:DNA-directed RNA polymerase specialized sigma24 family protein
MSYAAIAEALGLSTNEVRRVERRALRKLYLHLTRDDFSFEDMSPEQRKPVRLYEPD